MKALSPKGKTKYQFSSSDDISTSIKLSLKARKQPRRQDGRFSKPIPKPAAVENNPLVRFVYKKDTQSHACYHTVRLISASGKYYVGLDLVDMNANKWQYKKFITAKVMNFEVVSFMS